MGVWEEQGSTLPRSLKQQEQQREPNTDPQKSAQPCGCDEGADHKCEWHSGRLHLPDVAPCIEAHDAKLAGIEDSGMRQRYSSGALRDPSTGKIDWTRITYGPMMRRWAQHLTTAEAKYPDAAPGVPNFTLINTYEELLRYKKSAFRHFMDWYFDKTNEDHAAATFFNINGVEIIKAKMRGEATDNMPAPSVHVATIPAALVPAANKGSSTLAYESGE